MKIHEKMQQRTPEWYQLRLGKPTASSFGELITPTGKPAASANRYINKLIAERLSGVAEEGYINSAMQHGIDHEENAMAYYELMTDYEIMNVGFVTNDNESYGCSPDGLVTKSNETNKILKGVEIKCPQSATHIEYLRENKMPSKYIPQVQGCMLVTDAQEWDFVSWHKNLPNLIVTIQRDDEFITKLNSQIEKALTIIETSVRYIKRNFK